MSSKAISTLPLFKRVSFEISTRIRFTIRLLVSIFSNTNARSSTCCVGTDNTSRGSWDGFLIPSTCRFSFILYTKERGNNLARMSCYWQTNSKNNLRFLTTAALIGPESSLLLLFHFATGFLFQVELLLLLEDTAASQSYRYMEHGTVGYPLNTYVYLHL